MKHLKTYILFENTLTHAEKKGHELVDKLIDRHGDDSKEIHRRILDVVNSEYGRTSNQMVTAMWNRYNEIYPS